MRDRIRSVPKAVKQNFRAAHVMSEVEMKSISDCVYGLRESLADEMRQKRKLKNKIAELEAELAELKGKGGQMKIIKAKKLHEKRMYKIEKLISKLVVSNRHRIGSVADAAIVWIGCRTDNNWKIKTFEENCLAPTMVEFVEAYNSLYKTKLTVDKLQTYLVFG